MYDLLYRYGSEFEHSGIYSATSVVIEEDGHLRIRGGPDREFLDEAILCAGIALTRIVPTFAEFYGLDLTNRDMRTLEQRFMDDWNATSP
jgi:hypothetical protein